MRRGKGYSAKNELIFRRALITFSSRLTAAERLTQQVQQTGSTAAAENVLPARVRTLMLLMSLFFSQENARGPKTHRTMC